jgi:2-polyprenyl-3-methyl-5-hydroxy-6-metoxy-1,4-benzoquinol methylase
MASGDLRGHFPLRKTIPSLSSVSNRRGKLSAQRRIRTPSLPMLEGGMANNSWKIADDSDSSWENYGRSDAYYGVLSTDKFRNTNLSETVLADFMQSGETHIQEVMDFAEKHLGPVSRGRALDFGCGVGRLLLPLARRFGQATGLDISDSMLAETRRNAAKAGIENIDLAHSPAELAEGLTYDFIHSVIVLQHIPTARGEALIAALLSRLAPGGVAALHLNLRLKRTRLRAWASRVRRHFTVLNIPANLINRRRWNEPMMQMNEYSLRRVLQIGSRQNFSRMLVQPVDLPIAEQAFVLFRRD